MNSLVTLALSLASALLLPPAAAQEGRRGRGVVPAQPPLVRWQRTLADAEATAKATGQPLLICVNQNLEPASERLAHDRYTSEAFAGWTKGFVAVIASPDRHTPRDYDDTGKRVPCPRFGCVTCGEHIAIEPLLFAKFFNDRRVAPRHIGVGSDGSILFDIFLTDGLEPIDAALREHGKPRREGAASPFDSASREQEEARYLAADRGGRAAALRAAASSKHLPYDLIRLGVREPEAELRALARQALAATATPAALALVLEVLDDEPDRDARRVLVPVLAKIADDRAETKLAQRVHAAMLREPKVLDRAQWAAALRAAKPAPAADPDEDLDARIEALAAQAQASGASAAYVELGQVTLRFARARIAARKDAQFLLADAEQAAAKALAKDGSDPRAHALRSEVAQMLGKRDVAAEHARVALPALLAAGEVATVQAGLVLAGLAEGSARAIYDAEGSKTPWPEELLSEADAAYATLAVHAEGTPAQAGAHYDVLAFLGLRGCAQAVLVGALQRFAADPTLHERFRRHVTQARGVEALTAAYADLGKTATDAASHSWFAGFAELVVAEHCKRQGDDKAAVASYERAVGAFLASQRENPAYAASASWYAAMAQAGRARASLDLGDVEAAAKLIVEGIKRLPAVVEQEDGLGRTPLFTLKQVLEACASKGLGEVRAGLERELATTVPEVWAKAIGQ